MELGKWFIRTLMMMQTLNIIFYTVCFSELRRCRTVVLKSLIDCLCCFCTPYSCAEGNTRLMKQPYHTLSVQQDCVIRAPREKIQIARNPGSTTITPYMASLLVISLAAFMELEEKRKARVLHRQQIRFIFAKEEAEFILASF